ncbi:hypothetical protein ACFXKC_17480 [Streptomyces sp. NPDC059340]|uniref:hypothetical protein n=1 Tax=Streptomyces sp. NPDC059340 TaxID=3346806 RepID=UPI0036C47908
MMYDVQLPGFDLLLIECVLCGARPDPDHTYSVADPPHWTRLWETRDKDAITRYLVKDGDRFQHGTRRDEPCPAIPLPGPALHKLSGQDAIDLAVDLKDLLCQD